MIVQFFKDYMNFVKSQQAYLLYLLINIKEVVEILPDYYPKAKRISA